VTNGPTVRAGGAAIEGSLREMPLADVLQLLELGRRTGVLRVEDAGVARAATLVVVDGRIASATIHGLGVASDGEVHAGASTPRRAIVDAVCDVLAWRTGRFAVAPLPGDAAIETTRRGGVAVDAVLLEAAHRADEWARLSDRVPTADVTPMLAVLPAGDLLTLSPEEWRVVALADGALDLRALAAQLDRDVLAVARDVHHLLEAGVLRVPREPTDGVPPEDTRSSVQ
jgi:hypothetical protein